MERDESMERYMAALAVSAGAPAVTVDEAQAVLDLARVVAHSSERRFAPVSAYLAGLAATADLSPEARVARIRSLTDAVRERDDG